MEFYVKTTTIFVKEQQGAHPFEGVHEAYSRLNRNRCLQSSIRHFTNFIRNVKILVVILDGLILMFNQTNCLGL